MADATVTLVLNETLFHCQICMEHNMCRFCLQTLALRHCVGGKQPADGDVIQTARFPCPECRKECRVGKVGSVFNNKSLLANRLLKHLADEADKYSENNSKKASVQALHPEHLNYDFQERE